MAAVTVRTTDETVNSHSLHPMLGPIFRPKKSARGAVRNLISTGSDIDKQPTPNTGASHAGGTEHRGVNGVRG